MKHIITLASFVLLAWIGCKKSDDIPTPDTPIKNRLVGTSWKWSYGINSETITFQTSTTARASGMLNGSPYTLEGTYEFSDPEVTFYFAGAKVWGKISGNTMVLNNELQNEIIYTKQ
jgi:hypothetical protein